MSVGQPEVKGNRRQFHRKAYKETEHEPPRSAGLDGHADQLRVIEGRCTSLPFMEQSQTHYRDQEHKTPGLGEQKKFERGVASVLMPPERDEQIHRHEHEFPEEKEKEEIQREKHTDHAGQD